VFLSIVGFIVSLFLLWKLLSYLIPLVLDRFYQAEESLAGRQIVERIDDAGVNRIVVDALAAFTPGRTYLLAGALGAVLAILAVPVLHWLYAVWIRFIMLFEASDVNPAIVYGTTMRQIAGYMLRVAINAVAFTFIGMYYAARRRRYQQQDQYWRILLWRIPALEGFGICLGWLLYFIAAILPRYGPNGWFTFIGLLTLGGGWVWIFSGVIISWYLRVAQNAMLWLLYRYRWSEAIPAVVRMMILRRLELPASVIKDVAVNETAGAATIRAEVDIIDADRLRDSLLAVPGLRRPTVVALGPPPGSPVKIGTQLAPRMRPLPPRAFRRPQGPPKGYNAEYDLLDPAPAPNEKAGAKPDGTTSAKPDGKADAKSDDNASSDK
jgi:hypothetical protein